jgi:histidine triad (HIT) family protein
MANALLARSLLYGSAVGLTLSHGAQAQPTETFCVLTSPYDQNNPFAKILRKESPSSVLYEDDHVLAFLDIDQGVPGHALVIPKRAVRTILDMTLEEMGQVLGVTQRIAIAMQRSLNATGFKIQHNTASGGQTVCHAHFHVLPAFDGAADQGAVPRREVSRAELDAMAARLRAALPAR